MVVGEVDEGGGAEGVAHADYGEGRAEVVYYLEDVAGVVEPARWGGC